MRVGIIGCGNIAEIHIPFILNNSSAEIVSVYDIKKESARYTAEKYNIKDHYSDLDEMLDKSKPDVVHILTPVQTHAALIVKSLRSGCHVFVEKAMCLNKKESSEIIETAREYNRKVCVDHTLLFDPLFERAKKMLETGALGEIIHIEALCCDDHLKKKKEGLARQWVDRLPGGILNELLPHPLYLIINFLPEISFKSAHINRLPNGDIANFSAFFITEKAEALIRISLTEYPIQQSVTFHCTNGIICVDYRNLTFTVKKNMNLPGPLHRLYSNLSQAGQILRETFKTGWGVVRGKVKAYAGLQTLIDQFYQSINQDKASPVSEHYGAKTVLIMNDVWDYLNKYHNLDNQVSSDAGHPDIRMPLDSMKRDKAKILVTGATGFIGSYLAGRLVNDGKTVRVLCRKTSDLSRLPEKNIEIVYGDMRNIDSLNEAVSGIELIYHCAAATKGKWIDHYEGTIDATRQLCNIAKAKGVNKIVYISTTGIYNLAGIPGSKTINESSDLEEMPDKRGFYTKAKLEAEKIVKEFMNNGKLNISIIRPGIVYGNGGRKYIADAGYLIKDKIIMSPGLRNRPLHPVYVENLVDAIIMAGESDKSNRQIFNIVDSGQPTVHQYLKKYKEITNSNPFVIYIPIKCFTAGFWLMRILLRLTTGKSLPDLGYRFRSLTHNIYDLSKAETDLHWHSRITLDEALRKTFVQTN